MPSFSHLFAAQLCRSYAYRFRTFRSNSFAFLLSATPFHLFAVQSLAFPFHSQSALLNAIAVFIRYSFPCFLYFAFPC
uniref:Uncharacterized protein n=1 Tax=Siphoviridae sp. ct0Xn2 TaxID=2826267 RepID=A0A8S5MTK8_9CAUD|nr:MAG TPA: hypothetical protein [Siphoviridae sp. ct0Xn2]